jgi:4-hydroxy-tetrahydrodipicolinate synthase
VPISLALIERLLKAYPGTIAGVKDSSGDWNNTAAMLEQFQPEGFDVFAGSETFLLANMRGGGAGCITATGNVNPAPMVALYESWQQEGADEKQRALDATRAVFQQFPLIPAMKAAIAWKTGDDAWRAVRPPLVELNAAQAQTLEGGLQGLGFRMPYVEDLM